MARHQLVQLLESVCMNGIIIRTMTRELEGWKLKSYLGITSRHDISNCTETRRNDIEIVGSKELNKARNDSRVYYVLDFFIGPVTQIRESPTGVRCARN